jgi:hypothetical protein
MKAKLIVASVVIVAMASPALADYYVVQNTKTHKCSVAAKKPSTKSKTLVLVGDAYKTKAEATTAMEAASECKAA